MRSLTRLPKRLARADAPTNKDAVVPFLLPMAIVVIAVLAASLFLFVRFYHLATPNLALVRRDRSHSRPVLLEGGAFGSRSGFDRLSMVEREVVLEKSGLVVVLRPRPDDASVLLIVERLGCDTANDAKKLAAVLDGAEIGEARELESALQARVDEIAPGFEVVATHRA
jgi:hypothetical protein